MGFEKANKLEEKLIDAIQDICRTRKDVDECKEYFTTTTINELIEENSEDLK